MPGCGRGLDADCPPTYEPDTSVVVDASKLGEGERDTEEDAGMLVVDVLVMITSGASGFPYSMVKSPGSTSCVDAQLH